MGSDRKDKLKSITCPSCGGALSKSTRTQYDEEDEEDVKVPVARCIQCNTDYDQHTTEYYELYADDLSADRDSTLFKLGLKGNIKGREYEIIGRLRYQEEEEYEKATWDEWVAISEEGTFHYFVEEDGRIDSYEEYVPESIDMESDSSVIIFEGRKILKSEGYIGRIVYAEGELPWKPEIGEATYCYDFKKGGNHFTIEKSDDEVSITKGERITHGEIIEAFNIQELKDAYTNTLKKRSSLKNSGRVFLAGMLVSLVFSIYSCFDEAPVAGVMNTKTVLVDNVQAQDAEGNVYESQLLYGPFDITDGNTLYDVSIGINEKISPLNLQWQSFRFMLISETRLNSATGGRINEPAVLKEVFEEIDAMPEPVESYVLIGDFWDEEGRDSDGYWHESDTSYTRGFVLDDPGKYYVYLELFNNRTRALDATVFSITKRKGYRYYVFTFFLFFILWGVCQVKSRSYNELPFKMSGR